MAKIPGGNAGLGQGLPGGAGGLPGGLPLPGGGVTGPPTGTIPRIPGLPSIAAPQAAPLAPSPRVGLSRGAGQVGSGLTAIRNAQNMKENQGSTKSIKDAFQILLDVENGTLKPDRAAKLMQGLTPGDQGKLADLVSSHFATKGSSDRNVLKALQTLQKLPAPEDVQPHDVLTNLTHDVSDLVTGLPAGLGLGAVYGAKDLGHALGAVAHGKTPRGKSELLDKVIKPVGQSYAQEYGPLFHGKFGEELQRLKQHPLQPILDALTVASAGIGTAGRIGRAGEAINAARGGLADSVKLPARTADDTIKGMNHANAVDELGTPHRAFKSPTPQELKDNPYLGKIVADITPDGKVFFGSGEHDDLWARMDQAGHKPHIAGTVILDPATGKPVRFNIGGDGERAGLSPAQVKALEAKGLKAAQAKVEHANKLPGDRIEPEIDDYGMSTFPDFEKGGPDIAAPPRMVHGHTAEDVGGAPEPKTGIPQKFFQRPTPKELEDSPYLNHFSVFHNHKTGESIFGPVGSSHDEILEAPNFYGDFNNGDVLPGTTTSQLNVARMAENTRDPASHSDFVAGTGVFDPETGEPAKINFGGIHSENPAYQKLAADALENAKRAYWRPEDQVTSHPSTHEIEPTTGLSKKQLAKAGIKGFMKGGPKGNLIEAYETKRGITHEAEIQNYMREIADVLTSENLRVGRRGVGQVVKDVAADIRATRAAGRQRPAEMSANLPGFISPRSTGRALSAGETSLREASDMVRAGAIYLRPAYLPNNWAGNTFMNATHMGAWAPLELGKSLVIHNHMDPRNLAAMRKSMGTNPAEAVTQGRGRGYVASVTQPIAHLMGMAADQPFRDAAFLHEARRAGYRTLKQVDDLFNDARFSEMAGTAGNTAKGDAALREIANISRKAQEEIVKFGHMNDAERSVIRNLVFVYSWMRGAGRYASRFPLAHPIQTNFFDQLSKPGNEYDRSIMGGVPSFMSGVVPIGRDKNGNPIVINPFSLNPLGTGLQLARAAAGTLDVIRDPKSFNKFAQEDVVGLLNPILGSYLTARDGGQPMKKQLENTIAALALKRGLQHPGSGSIYPTSRKEAVGHFGIGALFPRVADQAAVSKALARENTGHPEALIPQQIKDFKKITGEDIPPQLVSAYQGDLEALQMQKDFQSSYAEKHGSSGFRNMPAQNRVDAALQYLQQHSHIPPKELAQLKHDATQLTTDEEFSSYANALWGMTGAGQYKEAWDSMMRAVKGGQLTRKRK